MIQYVIEHIEGKRWWSMQGWISRQDMAYRFPYEEAAHSFVSTAPHLAAHNIVSVNIDDERRPDAVTDYDPFGFNRMRG